MSEFVEECRREWKRLHVPDPIANEMVADLVADLEEAEADGASPEEVLGNAAFDPRTFAASWALERGLVQEGWRGKIRTRRVALAAIVLLVLAAGGVAIGVIASSRHAPAPVATASVPARTIAATHVPDLFGLRQEQAVAAAQAAGLTISIVHVASDQPAGTVVKQTPPAGAQLARGATLMLSIGTSAAATIPMTS